MARIVVHVLIILKEIGTIKRCYSVYDVYYGLLHFIQPSVITKCCFLYPKNGVRSVNLSIPAKTSKLMSYGSRGVDASDTTFGLSNFSANHR